MKRFLLLLMALVALSAPATDIIPAGFRPLEPQASVRPGSKVIADDVKIPDGLSFFAPQFAAPSRSTNIIYDQPEGELKTYYRSGGAIYFWSLGSFELLVGPQDGKAYVVYADDGKVYLKDPVYGLNIGTWVEGRLSDDGTQIIVPLGQTLYEQGGNTLDLCWGSTTYTGEPDEWYGLSVWFTIDESVTEAVYTIDGDCLYLEDTEGNYEADFPDHASMTGLSAAWSDYNRWNWCIDYGTVYTERPFGPWPVIEEQPEGKLVDYLRCGEYLINVNGMGPSMDEQYGKAYCVFGDDGKVYIMDPIICGEYQRYRPHPNISTVCWVDGSLSEDGTTVTVPMGQGLGWDEENDVAYVLANVTISVNEDGQIYYHINEDVTEMTYTIDGNKLILNGTDGDMNAEWPLQITGLAECRMYPRYDYAMDFTGNMEWNTVFRKIIRTPVVPADPSLDPADFYGHDVWYDCGNESGRSELKHYIKLEDVDGNPIDEQYVTYSIFTDDDQLFTFEAATYQADLTQDLTELPYNRFAKALKPNFTKFYRTNAEGYDRFFDWRIGIQVYYTVEGVRNASNIVYYEVFEHNSSGVNEMVAGKTVAGVKYYNMAGQEMREPEGICIAVTTYTDGTTSAAKVIK